MALPPTQLYKLARGNSDDVYQNLKSAACLNEKFSKEEVIRIIRELKSTSIQKPMPEGWSGPSSFDHFISALKNSDILNDKGRELAKKK